MAVFHGSGAAGVLLCRQKKRPVNQVCALNTGDENACVNADGGEFCVDGRSYSLADALQDAYLFTLLKAVDTEETVCSEDQI